MAVGGVQEPCRHDRRPRAEDPEDARGADEVGEERFPGRPEGAWKQMHREVIGLSHPTEIGPSITGLEELVKKLDIRLGGGPHSSPPSNGRCMERK